MTGQMQQVVNLWHTRVLHHTTVERFTCSKGYRQYLCLALLAQCSAGALSRNSLEIVKPIDRITLKMWHTQACQLVGKRSCKRKPNRQHSPSLSHCSPDHKEIAFGLTTLDRPLDASFSWSASANAWLCNAPDVSGTCTMATADTR